MTAGTEQPQEFKEVPRGIGEASEAKKQLDRATIEPKAAVEQQSNFKTA